MWHGRYNRGYVMGTLTTRLDKLDIEVGDIQGRVRRIEMSVQRLTDLLEARDATIEATAKAVAKAEELAEKSEAMAWSPILKLISIGAGLATFAAVVSTIIVILLK